MAKRLIHTAQHTTQAGAVHTAKVYRDSEWNEWVVKFAANGVKLEKADYHAGDKADAVDTANYHIGRIAKQFA
jgi:hypothetical protein